MCGILGNAPKQVSRRARQVLAEVLEAGDIIRLHHPDLSSASLQYNSES